MGMIRVRMCEDKSFSRINSWCKVYKLYLCAMFDTRSDRYFPAHIAYHSVFVIVGCPVLPEFSTGLRLAADAQILGPVYPELPRRPDDSSAGQNHFHFFTLADGSALRRFAFRIVVAADRYGSDGCLCDGLYPVFQDTPIYRMKYKSYST